LLFAWLIGIAHPAAARPQYAMAEGVPCAYCHVSAAGGGPRIYRGVYYGSHGHSFVGFDDAAEAKAAGVPIGPAADHTPASLHQAVAAVAAPSLANGGSLVPSITATGQSGWYIYPDKAASTSTVVGSIRQVVVPVHPEQYFQLNYDFPTPPPDGASVVVHFRARADSPYHVYLLASRSYWQETDYTGIGLGVDVAVGPDFHDYSFPWTVKSPHPAMNKICFVLNGPSGSNPQPVTLQISDFTVTTAPGYTLPPPPPVDPNQVPDLGRWRDPVSGIWFVKIPAGTYTEGSTDADRDALTKTNLWSPLDADETPAHAVTITRPFLISERDVTQAQWHSAMAGVQGGALADPSAFKGDQRPVDSVRFDDAEVFCQTLSAAAATGSRTRYRLPTEAEWEYAARAGGTGPLPLGTDHKPIPPDHLKDYCWMNGTAPNATGTTGAKLPNAWGLYDMLGNVWQWCQDEYSARAYTVLPPTDPIFTSPNATERVLRGGSWFLDARAVRTAQRSGNLPDFKSPYVGVRLVRDL
jgi:formylglycine-generating enzyme required for sulfatase activity